MTFAIRKPDVNQTLKKVPYDPYHRELVRDLCKL